MPAPLRLTLYSRTYCHLCHDMQAALQAMAAAAAPAFELEVLDIDADPQLEQRFNELVPVLMHGERELARYHLDAAGLIAYLQSCSPSAQSGPESLRAE
jgi:hypothetical protein